MLYANNDYRKYLQPYANKLRKNMTKSEACLWKYALKSKKTEKLHFQAAAPCVKVYC